MIALCTATAENIGLANTGPAGPPAYTYVSYKIQFFNGHAFQVMVFQ